MYFKDRIYTLTILVISKIKLMTKRLKCKHKISEGEFFKVNPNIKSLKEKFSKYLYYRKKALRDLISEVFEPTDK